MSMSVNDVISNYTYTYQSELRPILDRDYDSAWSKEEVAQYAADYKAATGTELDVDAIFNQYDADSSGALEFTEYETAADGDAFGVSVLSQKQAEAASALGENAGTAASSSNTQSAGAQPSDTITSTATLDDVLSDYTYNYKSEMNLILDKDYDGAWSQEEVAQYAADYKSATGVELDVDAIFKQYDADGSKSLEFNEYRSAGEKDAFGVSLLSQKQAENISSLGNWQNSAIGSLNNTISSLNGSQASGNTQSSDEATSATANMSEWLQSLSDTTRSSLVNTTVWADNTSNLLNAMLTANSYSYSNIGYGLMQYTNINAYASSLYKANTLFMNA